MTYFAMANNQTNSKNNTLTENCHTNNMPMIQILQSFQLLQLVKVCQLFVVVVSLSLTVVGCGDESSKQPAQTDQKKITEHTPLKVVSHLVLGGASNGDNDHGSSQQKTKTIRTLSGQVISAETTSLSFESSGRIKNINVKMGSRVKKGDVLAEIDDTNYQLQLRQSKLQLNQTQSQLSQAQLKLSQSQSQLNQAKSKLSQAIDQSNKAKKDVKRREELILLGAVSQTEVDSVRLALRSAEDQVQVAKNQVQVANDQVQVADNQVNVAKEQVQVAKGTISLGGKGLQDTRLTAPFSGVIVQQLGEVGQIVSPSVPVFTLATDNDKEVRVTVPENLMTSVGMGQPMLINFPAIGVQARGTVTEVSSQAVSGSFPVIIKLINPAEVIRSGMTVEVAFQVRTAQEAIEKSAKSFSVPPSAVGASNINYVYRIKQEGNTSKTTLEKVPVVISDMSTNGMRIRATGVNDKALQAGDTIVRTGVSLLQDGQPVLLMGEGSKRVNP